MDTIAAMPRQRFTDLNQMPISVQLGSFTCDLLGWGFFEPRWWRNYLHTHSFFEICYAFEGAGIFRMQGIDYPVCAGDVFVAKPSEPHEIISSHEQPLGIYFWSYTLLPTLTPCADAPDIDALIQAFSASQRWVSNDVPAMSATLELLTEEIVGQSPGYGQSIAGLVVKLLLDTARAVTEHIPATPHSAAPPRTPTEVIAQRIVQYLHDNYSRPITIRDVAAQVHLSERHTSRLFRQKMQVSIVEYLTSLRINAAAQLLLNPRLSIQEVGAASGYPDVQHFTTLFRRHMGLPPAAFRQHGGTSFLENVEPLRR